VTEARSLSLAEHLDELRGRLIKAALAVVVGTIVAFVFRGWLFDLVVDPFARIAADRSLVFFRPTEAFTIFMRLSLFGGIVLASPVLAYQAWRFVSPAFTRRERRLVVPVVVALTALFVVGVGFGYWILERGLGFLLDFAGDRLEPVIGGNEYLTFAVRFMLVCGLAFEFPVFLFLAAALGLVERRRLAAARRGTLVAILVISALVTPGDPFTMLALAVPLYALYEATLLVIRITLQR
jgi:sec-independent protein translocase protein TatC